MDPLLIPQQIPFKGKTLVLASDVYIDFEAEAFFIVDFSRKLDDPDLRKIPASVYQTYTKQEKYMLFKYNVVLGAVSEL